MSVNTFIVPNDMSELCRVCLQMPEETQYLDLTTIYDEEDNLTYSDCFTICTQIDLNIDDGLPHHLCKSCGIELQMSYDFHKKIEESNQIIEQWQSQLNSQKISSTALLSKTDQSKNLNVNEHENSTFIKIIEEKYVISDEDYKNHKTSDETEVVDVLQKQTETPLITLSAEDEKLDEIEIVDDNCSTEVNIQHQISSDNKNSEAEISENYGDNLEIEDYQNLEALEDEETETLHIKYCDNTIPMEVSEYKIIENGMVNEGYLEYVEDFDEKNGKEEENDEIDVDYVRATNEQDTDEDHLRWQENVVAVANTEHLPIEIVGDDDDEGETFHTTSKYKSQDHQVIINDSSQDEVIEFFKEVEEVTEEFDSTASNVKENTKNRNSTGRKRHVGSYSCDYCNRVYPNYSRMKTHRRCHETDRPKFSCSICGRMYATKQARDCHVQTAHDKSGYTCDICNKVFAIRKSLEIHVRYHTGDFPYACKLCDRKFAQACHLNTHINVKHNQIRFSCNYPNCGKFFTSSTSLRNHEFTHGIMPFECEFCQQGYPAKSKLRVHIQRKHCKDMSSDELEAMRKFHVTRSKVNLVQFVVDT